MWPTEPTGVHICPAWKAASPAGCPHVAFSLCVSGRLTHMPCLSFLTCKGAWRPVGNAWENTGVRGRPGTGGTCSPSCSCFIFLRGHSRPGETQGDRQALRSPQNHHEQDLIWLWVRWQGRGRGPWPSGHCLHAAPGSHCLLFCGLRRARPPHPSFASR